VLCVGVLAALLGCATTHEPDPRYRPAESALEVIAVLRRHISDDTYRFPPAEDFTGRNVYRSSLLRLESLEQLHGDALRAARMDGVIAFAKGRALERLRAYDLAAEEYRLAADVDPELADEAKRSAAVNDELHEAMSVGIDLDDIAEQDGLPSDVDAALARFDDRAQRLEQIESANPGNHYAFVAREEIERTDEARAAYFMGMRQLLPDGDVRAAAEFQRLVTRHRDSKNASQHLLSLAELYEELAVEYVDAHPPESLRFDPVRFQELIEATSRLYEVVSAQDGRPEKLEASRRLEAFLAFALRVDRERFTP
jgi:tetratricopeptide (TPR) repeat protein